ncbi:MAG: amidohydrolase family protein [Burkholderiales bacterium]
MPTENNWPVPAGACDTHFHIYDSRVPMMPGGNQPSQPCELADYLKVRQRLGLTRAVVVQSSAYGTDNTVSLHAMAALAKIGESRGVATCDAKTPDAEIKRLDALGMRGFRYFRMSGAGADWDSVPVMARRAADVDWHVQLQFDGGELAARLPLIDKLPCDVVIDHIGRLHPPFNANDPNWLALLKLVESGRCWVKLSAPYHGSASGAPHYDDMIPFAQALLKAAPERMVWATNWPHPMVKRNFPDEMDLLNVLRAWVPDEAAWTRVLVTNPAALYRF